MYNFLKNKLYIEDISDVINSNLPFENLRNTSVLITGATGLIGSFLIDTLMQLNECFNLNTHIFACGRNKAKANDRFVGYWDNPSFTFVTCDINLPLDTSISENVDYIFHFASNTHPLAYSQDPIGTILPNVIGTNNLLEFAYKKNTKRVIFASSVEIYGENRGDVEKFSEDYLGYVNCNTLRAGYPESKRCGEALCQAYIQQKNLDVVIPRLSRVYGPTMLLSDSKALSQFVIKAASNENIVLKSKGNQFYSYSYVADTVLAIFFVCFFGKKGEAYNVSDISSDITLKELAEKIARIAGTNVVFELPNEVERRGYSTATKAVLDSSKLQQLGWDSKFDLQRGLEHTISIVREELNDF